jgi:hypothetical protein
VFPQLVHIPSSGFAVVHRRVAAANVPDREYMKISYMVEILPFPPFMMRRPLRFGSVRMDVDIQLAIPLGDTGHLLVRGDMSRVEQT